MIRNILLDNRTENIFDSTTNSLFQITCGEILVYNKYKIPGVVLLVEPLSCSEGDVYIKGLNTKEYFGDIY